MQFTGLNKLVVTISLLAAASCAYAGAGPEKGLENAAANAGNHPPFGAGTASKQPDMRPMIDREPPTQVPEPASIALFGLGLAGVLMLRRRK